MKRFPADLDVGTPVDVTRDDGSTLRTVTRSVPWQLGHGAWVVAVEGIAGGYALERVRPAANDGVLLEPDAEHGGGRPWQ